MEGLEIAVAAGADRDAVTVVPVFVVVIVDYVFRMIGDS
jgi:hypothetical protein